MKKKVSIVTYEQPFESVAKAINLSGALDRLRSTDRVFIKPNIVFWSSRVLMPPWGVITTSRVVEDVVKQIKDRGVSQIVIGEGTVTSDPKDRKTQAHAFETLGYNKIAKKYGVKLLNVFENDFKKVNIGDDITLSFAAQFLESDFVVSLPVLKTHAQTKVSLSYKNLKGCLNMESRKRCHSESMDKDLDYHIACFEKTLHKSCAIIDGIYTLERGPAYTGKAKRSDILIASEDMLSADIAGTLTLGIDPAEVPHIAMMCKKQAITPSVESLNMVGEPLESVASYHQWEFPFNEQNDLPYNLERLGVKGLSFPKYDHSICTYCSELIGPIQVTVGKSWKGDPFDNIEILTGKIRRPACGMKHTILLGKCQVKLNKDHPNIHHAIVVPGCPPKVEKLVSGLKKTGMEVDPELFTNLDLAPGLFMKRYEGKPEFSHGFYRI